MLKIVEKSWNEFWAYYWRVTDRHKIPQIFKWDEKLVNFIEHLCGLSPGAKILDLGCGGGDQAKIFAQKGYEIVGIDIAPSLIDFAKKQFKENRLEGMFLVGDMRSIEYKDEFDLVVILSGTFGFFDDTTNQKILVAIKKALRPGGSAFIMPVTRRLGEKHQRTWQEIEDGWELNKTWFDTETNTYQGTVIIIQKDGTIIKPKSETGYNANEVIRCYTVPEMKEMLRIAGLNYLGSYSSADMSIPAKPAKRGVDRNIILAGLPR